MDKRLPGADKNPLLSGICAEPVKKAHFIVAMITNSLLWVSEASLMHLVFLAYPCQLAKHVKAQEFLQCGGQASAI